VYDSLMAQRDHPTAVELFTRVRGALPAISLATVYNCLETLTECGLVKTVNLERGPARYCSNLEAHAHFHCEMCGTVLDLPLRARRKPEDLWGTAAANFPLRITKSLSAVSARAVHQKLPRPPEATRPDALQIRI